MTGSEGQDWAGYQANNPPTAGLAFVIVKSTEGTGYVNPRYAAQIATGRAGGLVLGHYHFARPGSMGAQAAYFLANTSIRPGDALAFDWEDPGVSGGDKDAWIKAVQAAMPAHQVGLYCNRDYWLNRDNSGFYGDFLWIADPSAPKGAPRVTSPWLFHQYGSAGGVDRNYSPLTADQLRSWSHAKENPVPDLTPQIADDTKTLRGDLIKVTSLTEKDAAGHPAVHPASYYLAHTHYDAVLLNTKIDGLASQVAALAKSPGGATLTDAQVSAIAAQVAASPVLAANVATAVLDLEAKRLQS